MIDLRSAVLTFLFVVGLGGVSIAQEEAVVEEIVEVVEEVKFPVEKYKHKVGMAAGFMTGVGFSYQYKPQRFGVIVTGIPHIDEDSKFISAGVTFRYDVAHMEHGNVFIYQGNHYVYREEKVYDSYYDPYYEPYYDSYYSYDYVEVERLDVRSMFNTGVGLGGELFLGNRFTGNLMLGYGAHNNFTELNATIETGVYFRF